MGSRVRVEKFDDFNGEVRPDVQTHEFVAPDGVRYEIDLNAEHFAEMELDFAKYIKAGRKAKRQGKSKGKVAKVKTGDGDEPKGKAPQWTTQIADWATEHDYDWEDPEQRKAVRQWALDHGIVQSAVGVLPRRAMEEHHAARQDGSVEWPFT